MGESVVQVRDIERFHWQVSESECPISFSSNGGGISLAAAVELALIAAPRRTDTSEPHATIRVARTSIWGLIKESRWPLRLGCANLRDGESTVLILPTTHDDPWWTQRITTLLSDLTANGFPSHLARGLTGAVIEMVDNIWLHSETPHPGLLAASPEHLMRIIRCALDTGLRRGEILSQRWEDIDLDNRILHVSLSKTAEGEARGIPLTNALYDMLHASRQKRGPVFTYQGTDSSLSRSAYSANAIVP